MNLSKGKCNYFVDIPRMVSLPMTVKLRAP
jgi:hypothetical protein